MEMSDEEICRRYRQSGKESSQIKVLAQLNGVSDSEIIAILKAHNEFVVSVSPKSNKKKGKNGKYTSKESIVRQLLNEGKSAKDVAKEVFPTDFEEHNTSVMQYVYRVKKSITDNIVFKSDNKTSSVSNDTQIPSEIVQNNNDFVKARKLTSTARVSDKSGIYVGESKVLNLINKSNTEFSTELSSNLKSNIHQLETLVKGLEYEIMSCRFTADRLETEKIALERLILSLKEAK